MAKRMRISIITGIAVSCLLVSGSGLAKYPEKSVTVIAPFPAGGDTDFVARTLTEAAKPSFPKGIVVINRPGGGATIGVAEALRAKPDGYTLASCGPAPLVIGPHRLNLSYNTPNDYQPVIKTVTLPYAVAVSNQTQIQTMAELVAAAKANPGKLRIGHSGDGSFPHLAAVLFLKAAKVEMTLVPFSGAAEAVPAVIGGHVELCVQPVTELQTQAQANNLRILAVLQSKRDPLVPNVPAASEVGLDLEFSAYHSLIGPKGLPADIVAWLEQTFKKALATPTFLKPMEARGYAVTFEDSETLRKNLMGEYQKYGELLRQLGLAKK
jgi:tripartite-type tricarboxylate transporter receptor subunit TctC